MKLIERISADFMTAYKEKRMEDKNFLGLLKTDITRDEIEGKDPSDEHVIKTLSPILKNGLKTDTLSEAEIAILESYLPHKMTEEDLRIMITSIIDNNGYEGMKDMGNVMSFLKENHEGEYDGKSASNIVKELLG